MDSLFEKNLISTKEAAKLSGYTSDYIARLARSGKMSGRRVGHTWFVDRESLEQFLDQQADRKIDYARALARAREAEYRAVNSQLNQVTSSLTKTLKVSKRLGSIRRSVRSNALALSVAFAVIVSSALMAQIAALPALANSVTSTTADIAYGFAETFGDIPSRIAARIEKSSSDMRAYAPRVAENISYTSANLASAVPNFDFSFLQMAIVDDHYASRVGSTASSVPVYVGPVTASDIQASVSDTYVFVTNPSDIANSLVHAYTAIGTSAYAGIVELFSGYRSLIDYSGARSLAFATTVRDTLAAAPRLISEANLALGSSIIEATHVAIRADISLAYIGAEAAPGSAQASVAFLGETGNIIAASAARVPALATALYLQATEAPARLAPSVAQNVFDMEYAIAARFVDFSHAVSETYLALLTTTGYVGYDSVAHSAEFTHSVLSFVTSAPSVFEDMYLAVLGKSALALDSFTSTPKIAIALSATHTATTPLLAAVAPTLSTGEKLALTTYEAISGLFYSANKALAFLFGPSPVIVLPGGVAPRQQQQQVAVAATTGISEYFLDKSLASLRSNILATVATMIPSAAGPVQIVNNYYTIDHGYSSVGTTNSNSITATNGTFTNLSTNSLSIGTSLSTPYFTATSGTATSTFAGSLTVSGIASTSALTTNALTLSNLTGSIRCLHVDANGVVSATTGDCGSGGGNVSTSSPEIAGQLPYWTSTSGSPATLGGVATTTLAFSGPFTGASTLGALVGGTNSTITYTGLATTSNITQSNILYGTGGSGVAGVATTTLSGNNGLAISGGAGALVGGTNATIGLATINAGVLGSVTNGTVPTSLATSSLYGAGIGGQVLAWNNGVPEWVATSSINNGVTSLEQLGGGTAETGAITLSTSSQTTNGQTVGLNITNSSGAFTFAPTISGTLSVAGGGTGSTTLSGILTGNGTSAVTSATISSPLSFSGNTLSISQANTSTNGYLSSTDWNTFNGKQAALTGTTGQFPYFSGTNTVTATSSLFLAANGNIGIGSTSPNSALTIDGNAGNFSTSDNLLSLTAPPSFAGGTGSYLIAKDSTGATLFSINSWGNFNANAGADFSGGAGVLPAQGAVFTTFGNSSGNNGIILQGASNSLTPGTDALRVLTYSNLFLDDIGQNGKFIIGTSSTPAWLAVQAAGANAFGDQSPLFDVASTTSSSYATSSVFRINANGNVGIGTTTPGSLLSIGNTGGINFTLATSTFNSTGGVNLSSGCYAIGGNCVGTNASTITSGTLSVANGGTGSTTLSGILTGNGTSAVTSATISSPLSFSGNTLSISQANTSTNGYLSSTDWNTFNGKDSFAYPFPLTGNATSTLTQFNNGITAYASSTIGNGTQAGGLTISGGATTTGNVTIQNPTFAQNQLAISDGVTGAPPTIPNGYLPAVVVQTNQTTGSRPLFFGYNNGGAWNSYLTTGACGAFSQMCLDFGAVSTNYTALENTGTTLDVGGGDDGRFTNIVFANTGTSVFTGGNVGIGTTTPGSLLSIGNTGGINFTLATSTFNSTGGVNLSSGCYAIGGNCVGTNASTITSGTLSVANGGTGLASTPVYGNLLVGNSSNGYTLTATSSLGLQSALAFTYPLINTANTISTAFGTTTANSFNQLQQFNAGASSTQLTTTGSTYLATVGGNVGVGSTSPATTLGVVGSGYFTNGLGVGVLNTTGGTLQTSGNATIGSNLLVQAISNCNLAASAIQTNGSGQLVCGSITAIGGTSAGGWTWISPGFVQLATSTDLVGVGYTPSASSAKFTINSGGTATTTLSLNAANGQTANILDVYNNTLALSSVISSAGYLGISSTTPGSLLSIGNTGGINFTLATSTFNSTGGVNLSSGCYAIGGNCVGTNASTITSGTLSVANGGTGSTTLSGILTGNGTSAVTSATISSPLSFSGNTLSISQANTSTNGYLSSTDWNTFNGKQAALTGTTGQFPYFSGTNTVTATSTLQLASNGTFSVHPSLSYQGITVQGPYPAFYTDGTETNGVNYSMMESSGSFYFKNNTGDTGTWNLRNSTNVNLLSVDMSASSTAIDTNSLGYVGIDKTTPAYPLDVNGVINIATNASIEQGGLNLLTASTTQGTVLVGDAGINLIPGSTNYQDVAIGYDALFTATSSANNTAIGYDTLYHDQSGNQTWYGTGNLALGAYAGTNVTTGFSNALIGFNAGRNITTGAANVCIGYSVCLGNTTGGQNTAIGGLSNNNGTLNFNQTGYDNVAIGAGALNGTTSASESNSVGVGVQAGFNNYANDGTFVGYESAYNNTTGTANTAIGYYSLYDNVAGASNSVIGYTALQNATTSNNTVAIGAYAGEGSGGAYTSTNNIFIGTSAGASIAGGGSNTILGYEAANGITTGGQNVILGSANSTASDNQVTTGSNNISIGSNIALPSATANYQLDIGNEIYGTNLNGSGTTQSNGFIGIGTSTPGSLLSIGNTGGINFTLATSTFNSTGGVNLSSGCYAIGGNCVGTNASTITSGTLSVANGGTGQTSFTSSELIYGNGTNALSGVATSSITAGTGVTLGGTPGYLVGGSGFTINTPWTISGSNVYNNNTGNLGIGTTSPWGQLSASSTSAFPTLAIQQEGAGPAATFLSNSSSITGSVVGIGTTNPGADLEIVDSGTTNVLGGWNANLKLTGPGYPSLWLHDSTDNNGSFISDNNGITYFGRESGGSFSAYSMQIDASGNVGIGSASPPTYLLDVNGGAHFATYADAAYMVATSTTATSTFAGALTVGTNKLVVNSFNSNVGISSTTPGSLLSIGNTGGINFTLATSTFNSTGGVNLSSGCYAIGGNCVGTNASTITSGTLSVANGGTGQTSFTSSELIYGNGTNALSGVATSSITAGTGVTLGGTPGYLVGGSGFTINTPWTISGSNVYNNNTGNLGIGTTSPWGQLSASSTSAFPTLAIQQEGAGPAATFLSNSSSITGSVVGIGTTNPGADLEIVDSGTTNVLGGWNANLKLTGPGYPSLWLHDSTDNNGSFISDNNGITYFGRESGGSFSAYSMQIDASGNVGIGSASPPTYLLDVNGGAHFATYADAAYMVATSTTATSTFAGALTVGTNKLVVNSFNSNVGISSTTPGSLLSIGNTGGINFTLATSTFNSTGGVNLSSGCYAIGGNCVGTNASTITSGTLSVANGGTGQTSFTSSELIYGNGTNALSGVATSSITAGTGVTLGGTPGYLVGGSGFTINTPWTISGSNVYNNNTGNLGIGTTSPWGQLSASSTSAFPTLAIQQEGAGPAATFLSNSSSITGSVVGIGTTNPGADLEIVDSGTTNVLGGWNANLKLTGPGYPSLWLHDSTDNNGSFISDNNGITYFGRESGGSFSAYSMQIDASGNVGIGSASPPTYLLDVNGGAHFATYADAAYMVATSTTATSTFAGALTVGTNKLVVNSFNSNVGISSTTPGSLLSIGNTGGINFTLATSTFNSTGGVNLSSGCYAIGGNCVGTNASTITSGTLSVANGGTGQTSFTSSELIYGNGTNALSGVATSSITAGTGVTLGGTPGYLVGGSGFTINTPWTISGSNVYNNNTGNLGIGTTSPWGQLSASSTSAFPTLAIQQEGAGPAATFLSNSSSITGSVVGIGTTNPGADLEIVDSGTTNVLGGWNANLKLTGPGYPSLWLHDSTDNNGSFISDNNGITYFGRESGGSFSAYSMQIDASGNVGIGSASPPTYLLDVNGGAHFATYADAAYMVATSTTATSTFAGALTVGTNKLVVNSFNSNVGISSTTPGSLLSIGNTGGINFTLATSTFNSTGGVNLSSGCYAIGGNCVGTNASTITSGTLSVANGGTGQTSFTSSELIYGNGTNALSGVATSSITAGTGVTLGGTPGYLVGGSGFTINTPWTISGSNVYNNNTGNLGIGTTSPWGQLSASSTSAFPTLAIQQEGAGPAATFLSNSSSITGSVVGIGTTNPGADLEIVDSGTTNVLGGWNANLKLTGPGYPSLWLHDSTDNNGSFISDNNGITYFGRESGGSFSAYSMQIDASGNVGIGSASPPTYLLDVNGGAHFATYADAAYMVATSTTATSTFAGALTVGTNKLVVNSFNSNVGISSTTPGSLLSIGNTGGINFTLATSTFNSTGGVNLSSGCYAIGGNCVGTNASTITSGTLSVANGGTGSTTLSGILTGNGTSAVTSATISSPLSFSGNTLSISQANTSTNGYLSSTDWNTFNGKQAALTGTTGQFPYFSGTNTITATSSLFLAANGNVGVGTQSPAYPLDVNGTIHASGNFFTSASIQVQNAGLYAFGGWGDAVGGSSSGNYINFTTNGSEAMRIVSTGNVGISSTTPGSLLSIGNTGGINFTLATSTFNSTGGVNLSSGCYAIGGNCVGTNASTITSGTLSVANGGTGSTTLSGILTGNGTSAVTSATISSPLSFSGNTLSISQANTSTNGYLSSTDWNTFNGKQAALTGTTGQFPYFSGTNTVTATSSLFLAANGDVGIGTTTPQYGLDVETGSIKVNNNITGAGQSGTIYLGDGSFTKAYGSSWAISGGLNVSGGSGISTQQLTVTGTAATSLKNASSTQLTVTGNTYLATTGGNVGISSTTPGSLLSIGNTGGINFTLATSTFNSTGGVNLSSGCYAIGGNCVGTNASTITSGTLSVANGGTGSTTLSGILTGNGTSAVTSATISSPLSFSGNTLSISQANTSTNGYLSSTDWNTFNGKQAALTGTTGQFPYFSGTNTVTATSSLFLAANGNIGIGSTSPNSALTIDGNAGNFSTSNNLLSLTAPPSFAGASGNYLIAKDSTGATLFSINSWGNFLANAGAYFSGGLGVLPAQGALFTTFGNGSGNNGIILQGASNSLTPGTDALRVLTYSNLFLDDIGQNGKFIIGTSSTPAWLAVQAAGANAFGDQSPLFDVASTTSSSYATSSVFRINANGNVGIGTTTPGSLLSIGNTGGINFTLATSTFNSTGGVNLSSGCYAIGGNCVGTNASTITSGTLSVANGGTGSTTLSGILTGNGTSAVTSATISSPLSFSGNTLSISQANTSTNGYLSSTDWNTFNGKQAALTGTTGQFPYFSGTNTVTATSSLFLAANGNIGIGTTSPTSKLVLSGTDSSGNTLSLAVDTYTGDYAPTLTGYKNGTITGIQMGSPLLMDNGIGQVFGGGTSFVQVYNAARDDYYVYNNSGSLPFLIRGSTVSNPTLYFGATGNTPYGDNFTNAALTVQTGGNVGIGTTTPGSLLSIGNTGGINFTLATSTFNSTGGIDLEGGGCFSINGVCVGSGSGSGTVSSGTTGQFPYYAANGTTLTATSSLFLAANGNVGIGTTSPTQALSVLGNIRANGIVQSLQVGGSNYMFSMDATNLAGPRLQLGTLSSPAAYFEVGAWNNINNFDSKSRDFQLYASGGGGSAPVGLILKQATGNIGIGTTSPYATLSVTPAANATPFAVASSTNNTLFAINQYGEATFGTSANANILVNGGGTNPPLSPNNNIAIGNQALSYFTSGAGDNIALGYQALYGSSTVPMTGSNNFAAEYTALYSNTTGSNNNALGSSALFSNTTGSSNTALGNSALYANTTGTDNNAFGSSVLTSNTTGSYNNALGANALYSNTTGSGNNALGNETLYSNTIGTYNNALGNTALFFNTTGSNNNALGNGALFSNTTGTDNFAAGANALYSNTTGSGNIAIGSTTLRYNTTGTDNYALGTFALMGSSTVAMTGSDNFAAGNSALYSNTTGGYNNALGYQALYTNITGTYNNAFGYRALNANTTGNFNNALGGNALESNTTGTYNNAFGFDALLNNTTGTDNTAIGYTALTDNTTGTNNNALGHLALLNNTTGSNNTAIGYRTLYSNTTGSDNIVLGDSPNYGGGGGSGNNIQTGSNDIMLGYNAGIGTSTNSTGFLNIGNSFFGSMVATSTSTSLPTNFANVAFAVATSSLSGNTFAVQNSATTNNVASFYSNAGSSLLTIQDNGNVGIGTTTPGSLLSINGIANFTTATSTFNSTGGIDLEGGGCFSINGVCVGGSGGGGSGTVGSGTTGQFPYYAGSGTTLTATSSLFLATSGNVGIGNSAPGSLLSVGNSYGINSSGTTLTFVDSNAATTTIPDNTAYAWTIATSTTATPLFQIDTTSGAGSVSVGQLGGDVYIGAVGSPSNLIFQENSTIEGAGGGRTLTFGAGSDKINFGVNVGIGTTSPLAKLSVDSFGGTQPQFIIASSTGANATTTSFMVDTYGNVGIGTSSPATQLEVGGSTNNVTFDGYTSCTGFTSNANGLIACTASDQRLKQDIVPLDSTSGLTAIDALNPVSFYWKPETNRGPVEQYGLIAQQVQTVFPNLVTVTNPTPLTPDGTLTVNYDGLIAPMLRGIQQLDQRTKFIQNSASSTAFSVAATGDVSIGDAATSGGNLAVAGTVSASSFETTQTPAASFTLGSTTMTAEIPSSVLSASSTVDLYKLATYNLSGVAALAAAVNAQNTRITSLEARVSALESGAVAAASASPISLSTTSLISALNSVGVFIKNGFAQFGTLVADQFVAATNSAGTSSAGTITILSGNTVAQVNNAYVLPTTKVFVTFNSQLTGNWYVSDKQVGSFRLILSAPQTSDVSFDYFLVQTDGQFATSTATTTDTGPSVILSNGTTTPNTTTTTIIISTPTTTTGSTSPSTTTTDTTSTSTPAITTTTSSSSSTTTNTTATATSTTTATPTTTTTTSTSTSTTTTSTPTDTTPPVVTLNGSAAMQINVGDTFTDPGATATDNVDGNLTAKIVVTGTVNTATAGLYTLTYSATDAAGNTGSASRAVTVVAPAPAPTTTTASTTTS